MYNIGADSLRYYEEKGLITPDRTAGGYRMYRDTDIWRLNVIGELRSLDMSVDNIKKYLEAGSVHSTIMILQDELNEVNEKIENLYSIRDKLNATIDNILVTQDIQFETVHRVHFGDRCAYKIKRRFSTDEEMDMIMKQLADTYSKHNIIANHHIAAELSPLYDRDAVYSGALLLDERGTEVIPAGDYLSIFYRGKWNSRHYLEILFDYAEKNKLRLDTQYLDLVWIDIHTSVKLEDHISELQVRIRGTSK